jgi:hypothetical protein
MMFKSTICEISQNMLPHQKKWCLIKHTAKKIHTGHLNFFLITPI